MGVSKSVCSICREFILILERVNPDVRSHTSSCHGKLVAGWRISYSVAGTVAGEITKRIHHEVDEVIDRAARQRKSDSPPDVRTAG